MIVGERDVKVDDVLYEYNDIKKRICKKIGSIFNGMYVPADFVKIELKDRYVILYNTDNFWWTDAPPLYASTFEEAESISRELLETHNKSDGEWCDGVIVDLSCMIPEFFYDENTFIASEPLYIRF
jgi:hypothetical protein